MNGIYKGAVVYRNHDAAFDKTLSSSRTERKIDITMELSEAENGFKLTLTDEDENSASAETETSKDISLSGRNENEQIVKQLAKLGGTIFKASEIKISLKRTISSL